MRAWTNKNWWVGLVCGALLTAQAGLAANRTVRAVAMTVNRGQTNQLNIELDAVGDENGLQFSLSFDTTQLRFLSAIRGADAAGTTFLVNNGQIASGRVGLFIGLPTEMAFPAGTRQIMRLSFAATEGAAPAVTPVNFTNTPLFLEVSDTNGFPVAASYANGVVTIPGNCSYSLSTNAATFSSSSGAGVVPLTAADPGCPWTIANTNNWITIASGGSGSSNVNFTVAANAGLSPRTGVVVVAGLPFTVTQAGFSCSYALSPTNRPHGYGAATNNVILTVGEGCAWTLVNTNNWITFTTPTSGSGSATNIYTVAENQVPVGRTGVVQIADQFFIVVQAPVVCSYSLSPKSRSHGPGAANNSVSVSAAAGCNWAASTTNGWITITSGASGQGDGTVNYSVAANLIAVERIGAILVADQTLVLTQRAATCSQTLSPGSASHGVAAASGNFVVNTPGGCPWTASTASSWISVTGGASGNGTGTVSYVIEANPSGTTRSGTVSIAGSVSTNNFTITQSGQSCTFTLSPTNASHVGGVATGSVSVTTLAGCSWTVVNTNNWITINSSTNQTGSDTVAYTLDANPQMTSRTGVVMIAGQQFAIVQTGFACAYDLSPPSRTHGPGLATNAVTLTTSNGCTWSIVNTNGWISFTTATSGSGSVTNTYTVAANPNPAWRTGVVQIAGQAFMVNQQPVVCSYSLSPKSRSHGPGVATNNVDVTTSAGCPWTASTTKNWISILSGGSGMGNGTVDYAIAANPSAVERIAAIVIADQSLIITQRAASCTYELTAASTNHSASAGTGSVGVIAPAGCAWVTENTNSWIIITSGASGSGNGTVAYSFTANPNGSARTGRIVVEGEVFTITQAGQACSFTLSPTNGSHSSSGGTGSVSVTTLAGCAWSVLNTNSWITISSSTNQTGSDTVNYSVAANPGMSPRSATLVIAGRDFVVTQAGFTCAYDISPQSRSHGPGAATNTVSLTTSNGCAWNIVNTNGWITFGAPTSGSGSVTNTYSVTANPNPTWRTGLVEIADQIFTLIQQPASCSYSLSPKSRAHGPGAANNTVGVTAGAGCVWTASTTNGWISITSGGNGMGNGTVGYSVAANPDSFERIGAIMVADQSLVITQRAAACTVSVSPSSNSHGPAAGSGSFNVDAAGGCPWSVNTTNAWVTITSATNGTGDGTVSYSIASNPTASTRSATVTVTGLSNAVNFTISQTGQACTFTLSPTNGSHGGGVATGSVSVTTLAGCAWTVVNTNTWITINSSTNQTGNDTVNYTLDGNPQMTSRTGVVVIAGHQFKVTQAGLVCAYDLSPQSRTHGPGLATNTVTLTTSNGCGWAVINTNAWITFITPANGSGSETNIYTVAANPNPAWRTGVVQIAGQSFTVNQQPVVCSYSLSPKSRSHGPSAVTNSVSVTTSAGCAWAASTTNGWINILSGASGMGNGTVDYAVAANPDAFERIGSIAVADQSLVITQRAATCTYALTANSASHGTNAGIGSVGVIAPGGCSWATDNTNGWITITSGASGSGNGTVNYSFQANPSVNARSGVIVIGGELFTVNQAGHGIICVYRISTTNRVHGPGAATNSVNLTTSNGCDWIVINTNAWISISSATSGSGNATIGYTVNENTSLNSRTGSVIIADQVLTLAQQGAPCEFSISPSMRTHGFSPATNTIDLTVPAGCAWTIGNTNDWIIITSPGSGTGSATVDYRVDENVVTLWRTGLVMIADQVFTLVQRGTPCLYEISTTSRLHGHGAVTGTVIVTTQPGCDWPVVNTNSWITILSGATGTGSNVLTYAVAANPSMMERTGVVLIADQVLTIRQQPAPCTYDLSATSRTHGHSPATNFVSLTAPIGCPWSVVNTSGWITVTSPSTGSGNATINYIVATNPATLGRTGVVVIAGENFTLRQLAAPCAFVLTPASGNYDAAGGTGLVSIATSSNCPWSVDTTNAWITITTDTNGLGNGSFGYAVTPNSTHVARSGVVRVSGEDFPITQAGLPCVFTIAPTNAVHGAGVESNIITVTTSAGCAWNVVNTNGWINILSGASGSGNGAVNYYVDANPTIQPRSAVVLIAGRPFAVTQQGAPCVYHLSPTNRSHGFGAATGSVSVTAMAGCAWNVGNTNDWVTITSAASGSGDGSFSYAIIPNTNLFVRIGLIHVVDQTLTITQQAAVCTFSVSPTNRTHGNGTVTGSVSVTTLAGCSWNAASSASWISFVTSTNVTGSGSVTYLVETNQSLFWRTGELVIAERVVTLIQRPTPCTYLLSPSNALHGAGAEGGFVNVASPLSCPWTVSNTNAWITISSATNGAGAGSFSYELSANGVISARTGLVTVADQILTVIQDGMPCTYVLSPTNRVHGAGGENSNFSITAPAGCLWTASNTNNWITITSGTNGMGNGVVTYTVASNGTALGRSGVVTVAGHPFMVSQLGAACTFSLAPTSRSHGGGADTGTVSVTTLAGCNWTAATTNTWISITAGASGIGTGSVTYAIVANPVGTPRTGFITIDGQTFSVNQAGASCSYSILPTSRSHGSVAGSGSVGITAPPGCAWTASNTNAWIVLTSGTNGSGNGTLLYSVASNGTSSARSGTLTVASQTFTVTQDGAVCAFAITPPNRAHSAGSETGTVSVTAIGGCNWTVNNAAAWITILSGASGSTNGTVTYAVDANPASVGRTGTVDIAGQTFTIAQVAASCTYSITPSSWVHQPAAGTGMVSVVTPSGCNWTSSNTNSWVSIVSGASGSGAGTVTYTVIANPGVSDRLGVVVIAGQSFAISQLGSGCTYRLSPTNRFHGSGAATNTVSVTASNGCSWTAIPGNSWITILSNANGSGNAVVGYTVARNLGATPRSSSLNIGGELLTITQWGTNCGLALMPVARAHGSGSETGLVTITTSSTNCAWTTVNTNSWITINSGASGTGNGSLGYTVAANTGFSTRTGVISVNGETYTVSQAGLPCTYAISPTNRTHGAGAESVSVSVTAGAGCAWGVANTNGWITIDSGASGSGNGTVNYTAQANPTSLARSGVLVIAGKNYSVTQSGAPCTFALSPTNRAHGAGAETGLVAVTTIIGCSWTAGSTNTWITITTATNGVGSGSIGYAVSANPSSTARTGTITIGGQQFAVSQQGAACTFAISPTRRDHGAGSESGMVSVTSPMGCAWTVSNTNSWITITTGTNGIGSVDVAYTVAANASFSSRTGVVTIAGQVFTVTQPGANCSYTLVPMSRSHGFGAETGSVGVAAANGCGWAVANTNSWITIDSGANGSGSGTVGYSLTANPLSTPRSGVLRIGGQNFTVTQAGMVCTYALVPASRAHGTNAGIGTVDVTAGAGCVWSVVNTNGWITINSGASGNGNGTVNYSVTANSGSPRSGYLVIGGQLFAVSQNSALRLLRAVPMTVTLGQTNKVLIVLDGAGDENAVGLSLCYLTNMLTYVRATAVSGGTLIPNTGSTNRGLLGLALALNGGEPFPAGSNTLIEVSFRTAAQASAGVTTVSICNSPVAREVADIDGNPVTTSYMDATVTIAGACTYALATNSAAFGENGGTVSVNVTAGPGCAWSTSNTNSWVVIASGASGSGNSTVNLSISPNPTTAARSGTLQIAGNTFTLTQSGVPCAYVIVPSEQDHSSAAESGFVALTSLAGCAWTVVNTNSWITMTSATNGSGNATVTYNVIANSSSIGRTGVVVIAGQNLTVRQAGVPCNFVINPVSRAHGTGTETGLVTVTSAAGCAWLATSASGWITITSGASGSGNGTVGYRAIFNPNLTARTGTVSIAGQTFTVTQPGNACAVTLSPTELTHVSGIETGQVALTAASGCAWTVSNTNSWITMLTATNGTGNGTIRYRVSANPSGSPRSGMLDVAGQILTVNQVGAACVYAIAPSERMHGYVAESNHMVSVATFPGCAWTVFSSNSWITIQSPTNASGSGSVTYNVGANPSGFSRTGLVMIAGQPFVVTQPGAPCTYVINPTSRHHGFGVESGSITLATVIGCPWAVVNTNSWVLITSETNGTGSWGVNYTVTNNPTGLARTGVVMIASQPFAVSQAAAPCTFSMTPTNRVHGHGATNSTVTVTTLVGCPWSVVNTNTWISLLSPANNSGPGALSYAVEANPTAFGRTGTVSVAGTTLTLSQLGAPCTYDISPTNRTHGYTAITGTVDLASVIGCSWTVNNTNSWITILSSLNGTGSNVVTYAVAGNPSAFIRTGIVNIAGRTLTLVQSGAPCMFALTPSATNHTAVAQAGSFAVATAVGCNWTVSNTNSWITITTSTNGSGSGTVGYLLASNAVPVVRTGIVVIASTAFTVVQEGMVCVFSLAPTSGSLTSGNVTGLVNVTTSPLCSWVVVNTNSWIAIKSGASGTGPGLVRYTAAANPNPSIRVGYMLIGDVPFSVTQLGSPCSYMLSPTNRLHGSGAETNMINVLTVGECTWSVVNTNPWITILSGTNGAGNGMVNYYVDPNPASIDRTGRVVIAGQVFPVTQLGAACLYSIAPASREVDFASVTGSIAVTATIGCLWTVSNTNSWVTINSGSSGTNSGIVNYTVTPNYTPILRSGFIRVGSQFFSITQTGIVCTFIATPDSRLHGPGAETGQFSLLTSNLCPWTVSNTNTWITLLSPPTNSGSSSVSYSVAPNPTPIARSGALTVAGQTCTITQAGFVCTFTLNPPSRAHSFGAVTGLVSVATSNLCTWTLSSSNNWISFVGNPSRSNSGFATYVVTMNPSLVARTGTVSIAGQPFTITQFGIAFLAASNKTVECGTAWSFDPPTTSGTCADTNIILTVLSTVTNATCGSAYNAIRRWDALDTCGNRMTITQTVSVVVTAPPIIVCAPTKTVECGSAWAFDMPTATDACGGANVTIQALSTVNFPAGGCGGGFTSVRQWQVTDGCANSAMCSQTVVVVDTTPPSLVCAANRTVECGSAWNFDVPTVTDNCATNVTIQIVSTVTNTAGSCGGTYTATRLWEAVDGCTNRSMCSQTITVVDTTPPTITCPANKVVECSTPWNFDQPAAADACGSGNVTIHIFTTVTNSAGGCGNSFTATRTWEAFDDCGNRRTCSQIVSVVDTTPPTLTCPSTKTVEYGSTWNFDAPVSTDACGGAGTIRIVSTITNTAGFCGLSYGVTRTWEALDACSNRSATCSQLVRVVDSTAPMLTCAPNKVVSCFSPWTFDAPTALDAADGTNVTITIVSTVTNGTCASGFMAVRMWRATDACGNVSAICSQTVSAATQASVAGIISYHPTNYPAPVPGSKRLSPVPVIVSGATNMVMQTVADGSYSATVGAGNSYTVTPNLTNSSPVANGVSTLDISLIRRHILNNTGLDTPYKLLAADVNGSRSVTTLDISFIRRVILGTATNMPMGLWRFVPSDYVFPDPLNPWDAPTNRVYPSLVTPLTGQDFMAIKMGDVNNSWAPPISAGGFAPASVRSASLALAPDVTFLVSNHTNRPGDTLTAQIAASGFRDVTSAQWTLAWDPTVLRYTGNGKYGLKGLAAGNFGTSMTEAGKLTFSWDDPDALGVTTAEGATVFSIGFEVIGSAGTASPLWLSGFVTEPEVSVNFSEANLRTVNGQVTVVGSADSLPPQPQLTSVVYTNGAFGVPQQTVAGRRYILEYTESLPATNWIALPPVTGNGSVLMLTDPGASSRQRFYRLRIE